MSFKATKIGGASLLTALGVICLASFMIAAFTWSSYTTSPRNPQEVKMGIPTNNEWEADSFFQPNVKYDIISTATYNFHSASQISYYIWVIAHAGQGTIESGDFILSLKISDVDTAITEVTSTPGKWASVEITVLNPTASDQIKISITPKEGATDLGNVYFEIMAESTPA